MTEDTDWNSNIGGGFGRHVPQDEYFHGIGEAVESLTETWFWNFHVAESNINCFAYCWVHPTLKVVTGGVMIYQGIKPTHLACELFDMRAYMNMEVLGDGDIQLRNGFRVKTIVPMEHVHMTFDDPVRQTSIDVQLRGVGDPIMRANNKHFEQVMHATGTLVLRGKRYDVDCYPVRDRSWGEARPENHAPMPPYTWVTGTFGEDMAFNVGAHDDLDSKPEWLGLMEAPARMFKDGWVVVGGEQRRIVSARKSTAREMPWCRPLRHVLSFVDTAGDSYELTGEVIAQSDWSGWPNSTTHLGLAKWSWTNNGGRIGYGETQEVQWNDYNYLMNK